MCEMCQGIILRDSFNSDKDYLNTLEYITRSVKAGKFVIIEQTCSLDGVKKPDGCWVDDVIRHKIKCVNCGECFILWADTYHGRGGFIKEN